MPEEGVIANGYFDVAGVIAVVIKLLYGLNDCNWDFVERPKSLCKLIEGDEDEQTLGINIKVLEEIPK